MVTRAKRNVGRVNTGEGDEEIQTARYKTGELQGQNTQRRKQSQCFIITIWRITYKNHESLATGLSSDLPLLDATWSPVTSFLNTLCSFLWGFNSHYLSRSPKNLPGSVPCPLQVPSSELSKDISGHPPSPCNLHPKTPVFSRTALYFLYSTAAILPTLLTYPPSVSSKSSILFVYTWLGPQHPQQCPAIPSGLRELAEWMRDLCQMLPRVQYSRANVLLSPRYASGTLLSLEPWL